MEYQEDFKNESNQKSNILIYNPETSNQDQTNTQSLFSDVKTSSYFMNKFKTDENFMKNKKIKLDERIYKQARIQKMLNGQNRSMIQNYDTIQWLNKRYSKKAKNKYLNLPEKIKEESYSKQIFEVIDQNKSNKLVWQELYNLFRKYRIDISRRQIKDFFKINKTKQIGKMDQEEFKQFSSSEQSEELFRHIIRSIITQDVHQEEYDPEYLGKMNQSHLRKNNNDYQTKSTKIFEKKLQLQRKMSKEQSLDNQVRTVRRRISQELFNLPYEDEDTVLNTQQMSIDLDSISDVTEPSDEDSKKKEEEQDEKDEKDVHSDDKMGKDFVPFTFGTMMQYLCYNEQRKKMLKEIQGEQDILVKCKKFFELLNIESISEVDKNNAIGNEYKQKLSMQVKLNKNLELKKKVKKKIDFQNSFITDQENIAQEEEQEKNKDEVEKNELAAQIYVNQLEGLKNQAEFYGKSQAQSEADNSSFQFNGLPEISNNITNPNQSTFRSIKSYKKNMSLIGDSKLKDQSNIIKSNMIQTISVNNNMDQTNPVMLINDNRGVTKLLNDNSNQFQLLNQKSERLNHAKELMKQLKQSELKLPVLQHITKQHTIPYENMTLDPKEHSMDRLMNKYK